ncbi:MAG: YdeI/OmpD-associated family protein [Cyanobacteria bacterium P01_F01_bin.4]
MSAFDQLWEFEAQIEYHDFGRMGYTVVYLPESLRAELPFDQYPRLRVDAEVAEYPIDGAFQPGQGKYYLILSKRLLKQAGLALGDTVNVNFRIADQDAVDVPDELRIALQSNQTAQDGWDALTPGKRRGLAHRVSSARTAATRKKRVAEVISTLLQDS